MLLHRAVSLGWVVLFACSNAGPPGGLNAPDAAAPTHEDGAFAQGLDASPPADAAGRPDAAEPADVGAGLDAHTGAADAAVNPTPSVVLADVAASAATYAAAVCQRQSSCVVLRDWHSLGECEADETARARARLGLLRELVDEQRATFDDATFALCVQQLTDGACPQSTPACDLMSEGLGQVASGCMVDEECERGLTCTGAFEAQCGSCEAPGGRGTHCRDDRACGTGFRCGGRGVCTDVVELGRPCASNFSLDVVCATGTCFQQVCRATNPIGGACDGISRPCDAAVAVCMGGTCVPLTRAADGAACDATHLCHDDSICVAGTCYRRHARGEQCDEDDPIPCGPRLVCALGFNCIDDARYRHCFSDASCEPGQRCMGRPGERLCGELGWQGCD